MTNVVRLDDFRAQKIPAAASAAVGTISENDDEECAPVDAVEDEDHFRMTFQGYPDEIYDQVVDWLAGKPEHIGDIITVRQGELEFEDFPSEYWRERPDPDNLVIWEESLPSYDLDDGDWVPDAFGPETLLRMILDHPTSFKALLGSEERFPDERHNMFLSAFYCY